MALTPTQKKDLEARLQEFVGKPIGPPEVARDEVNEAMIRQWCDAMGDTNPAYLDPDVARQTVHGGIVAPPTMLDAWAAGYRSVAELPDEHLAELPSFIMARCLVGLGWLHTRRETDMARLLTDAIVQMSCDYAESLLSGRHR